MPHHFCDLTLSKFLSFSKPILLLFSSEELHPACAFTLNIIPWFPAQALQPPAPTLQSFHPDALPFQCKPFSLLIWTGTGHYYELQTFNWTFQIPCAQMDLLHASTPNSVGSHCKPILEILIYLYILIKSVFFSKYSLIQYSKYLTMGAFLKTVL